MSFSQLYKFTVNTDYVVVVKLCIQLRSQRLLQILPTSSQLRLKTQAREYMLFCTVCRWIGYSSNAVCHLLSMLLCFGHRKEHPACTSWVMRSWHGCLSWMRCRFFLHMVQPMLLPSQNLLPHLYLDWFHLFGTGWPRFSWKKWQLNGCFCQSYMHLL